MYILIGLAIGFGCYLLILDAAHAPTLSAIKAAANVGTENLGSINTLINILAAHMAKWIPISSQLRKETEEKLEQAHLDISVETYLFQPYLYAFLGCVAGLPMLLILPVFYLIVLGISLFLFKNEYKKADKIIKAREEAIGKELPRFVMTIAQELDADKSVFNVLNSYKNTAGPTLKDELSLVVSQMQIGSQEQALIELSNRIHDPLVNNIVKGLLSKLRGDDTKLYFTNLAEELKAKERSRIKMDAMKIPTKFEKYNFMLFLFFALMFFVPLIIQFMDNIHIFLS